MLLRFWTRAIHCPNELVKDIMERDLNLDEQVVATESLAFIKDYELALLIIRHQLENTHAIVVEAALVALRAIFWRLQEPIDITTAISISRINNQELSPYAYETLQDLLIENARQIGYKNK